MSESTAGTPYLSRAWFARWRDLAGDLPLQPGVTASVAHVVTGCPDGDVAYVTTVVDGRLVDAAPGDAADADITTTRSYADGLRIARGELDEAAAFMQGRLKLTGAMGTYFDLQRVTQSEAWRAATAALAAATVAP